ncbi:MAG TPA: TIGR02117 family protein [Bacteroidales bacterium]|jgi:uncharacterized protein (TIGR02117 family)|nr:TIGR02117 family protein [Bacteroidales bacterium]
MNRLWLHTKLLFQLLLKRLLQGLSILFGTVGIYLFVSVVFSLIPVNRKAPAQEEIEIYLLSNGVHIDLVLPVNNAIKNWSSDVALPPEIALRANYISFGWGDLGFYRNTRVWSDLSIPVALKAVFMKSPSAMHIDFFIKLSTDKRCRKVMVSENQYRKLVGFTEQSFKHDSLGKIIPIPDLKYYAYDSFYEAQSSYHLFNTCNTWTNRALKYANLRACLWTPFDRGILFHY